MRKGIHIRFILMGLLISLFTAGSRVSAQEKMSDSPYVKVYPGENGETLWTVEESLPWTAQYYEYETFPYWYEQWETISTGIPSALRSLETGEHYYDYNRLGEVPVGYWRVEWHPGRCIHGVPLTNYNGISVEKGSCGNAIENEGGRGHTCKDVSWNKYKVVYEKNGNQTTKTEQPSKI